MKRATTTTTTTSASKKSSSSIGGGGGGGITTTTKRRGGSTKGIPLFAYLAILPLLGVIFMIFDIISSHSSSPTSPDSSSSSSLRTPKQTNSKQKEVVPNTSTHGKVPNGVHEDSNSPPQTTIFVKSTGMTLPSATTLLTKSPPYNDDDIIYLSGSKDTMISFSPNTVVTAYYRIPSKFKPSKYSGWMKNMLSLQDPMIIFTSQDLISTIEELRNHATNRTVIIPLELNDLPIATLYNTEFWKQQLERDPEKRIHQSYELFWIWLSKTWWVNEAIRLNVYNSDLFMWSDIGCFRNSQYNDKTMIIHRNQIPKTEMIQMAHHVPNPPTDVIYYNDKYSKVNKPHFYHSGSQMAAYKDTWIQFHELFLIIIDEFLIRNMIIVEDQAILQSVCLKTPTICAYVPFDQVKPNDNHYFGLRYVVHVGGKKYNLWRQSVDASKVAAEKQVEYDIKNKLL